VGVETTARRPAVLSDVSSWFLSVPPGNTNYFKTASFPIHYSLIVLISNDTRVCVCVCVYIYVHIAHLPRQCHNSKCVIFQKRLLKVLKCYNFLYVQQRHNCSPAASFANCVMTLYLLKVHLQTFLSTPITQKCQISSFDTLCRKCAICRSFR
jgi:hypothetical protein